MSAGEPARLESCVMTSGPCGVATSTRLVSLVPASSRTSCTTSVPLPTDPRSRSKVKDDGAGAGWGAWASTHGIESTKDETHDGTHERLL